MEKAINFIRAYVTQGYQKYIKLPRAGMLINVACDNCHKEATMPVEEEWIKYERVVFKCRTCNDELGVVEFDKH
jgi:hypothetical protein